MQKSNPLLLAVFGVCLLGWVGLVWVLSGSFRRVGYFLYFFVNTFCRDELGQAKRS